MGDHDSLESLITIGWNAQLGRFAASRWRAFPPDDGHFSTVAAGDDKRPAFAARGADEPRLKLRDPDLIRPPINVLGRELHVVATAVVLAEHEQIANAG